MLSQRRLFAYFGHHKCASSWIQLIIQAFARDASLRYACLDRSSEFDEDLQGYVDRTRIDVLAYINADVRYVDGLRHVRGFHVVRDPRDLIVSAYFSHLYSHSTVGWSDLVPHRSRLESLSKDEGLLAEMDFSSWVLDSMSRWAYDRDNILEVRQEELTAAPGEVFTQIFEFLGLLDTSHLGAFARMRLWIRRYAPRRSMRRFWPFRPRFPVYTGQRLVNLVDEHSFSNLAEGRQSGEEDVRHHYRKGVSGDWVNHFTSDHIDEFKRRYNGLLLKLGYESDPDWSWPRDATM